MPRETAPQAPLQLERYFSLLGKTPANRKWLPARFLAEALEDNPMQPSLVMPAVSQSGRSSRWGALLLLISVGCSASEGATDPGLGSSAGVGGLPAATAGVGGNTSVAGSVSGGNGSLAGSGGTSLVSGGGGAGGSATGAAGSGGSGGALPHDGPTLFLLNCLSCHGDQGAGSALAPEIRHPVRDYATWVVRHGRAVTTFPKPMAIVAPDALPDADLQLIWDYLDQPPQPTTGQTLYHDYCANCHGADGKGGPTTRNILNGLAKLKDQVRKGAHPGEFDMRKEYMPAFSTTRLSDAEVQLIYDYVDSL